MAELPSSTWNAEQYKEWMKTGRDKLASLWPEGTDVGSVDWTQTARPAFLTALELTDTTVDSDQRLAIFKRFMDIIDAMTEDERRRTLLDTDLSDRVVKTCLENASAEQAKANVATTAFRPEAFGWVDEDRRRALGSDWESLLTTNLDRDWRGWKDQTSAEPLVRWLTSWWATLIAQVFRPEALGWVEESRRKALGTDWEARVTRKLDEVWSGWKDQTSPEPLVRWLVGWWGALAPATPGTPQPATGQSAATPAASGASAGDVDAAMTELNANVVLPAVEKESIETESDRAALAAALEDFEKFLAEEASDTETAG